MRIVEPSRAPAGIFTSIVLGLVTSPAPPHVSQACPSFTPVPPQVGQGSVTCICNVRRPPRCASSRDVSSSASMSRPRPLRAARPLPPPNISSKMSKPPGPAPGDRKRLTSKSLKWKPPARAPAASAPVLTILIVKFSILWIGKFVISLLQKLELLFCSLVIGIQIGMKLARQFAIGLLDFIFGCLALDAQHLVVVSSLGHRLYKLKMTSLRRVFRIDYIITSVSTRS